MSCSKITGLPSNEPIAQYSVAKTAEILRCIMMKEYWENLTLTEHIEGYRSRRKQWVASLMSRVGGGFRKQGQQVMEKNGKKLLEKQKLENYGVL